jgi:hypothetical protein
MRRETWLMPSIALKHHLVRCIDLVAIGNDPTGHWLFWVHLFFGQAITPLVSVKMMKQQVIFPAVPTLACRD